MGTIVLDVERSKIWPGNIWNTSTI